MDISKSDVQNLLNDDKLIDEVVTKIVANPEVVDGLAEDVAEEISNHLEEDPVIRKKIIASVTASADFRKRIVSEIVKEMADD